MSEIPLYQAWSDLGHLDGTHWGKGKTGKGCGVLQEAGGEVRDSTHLSSGQGIVEQFQIFVSGGRSRFWIWKFLTVT